MGRFEFYKRRLRVLQILFVWLFLVFGFFGSFSGLSFLGLSGLFHGSTNVSALDDNISVTLEAVLS